MTARRAYSDAEVEAAIEALSRSRAARGGPAHGRRERAGLQRILNEALHAADWFGSAHQAAVLEAAGQAGDRRPPDRRAHADRRGDERRRC